MNARQFASSVQASEGSQTDRKAAHYGWWLAGLCFLPFAILRAGTLAESDTFWQVRSGVEIIKTVSIPRVDSYSWTAPGDPWTLNSWAFNALLGSAYVSGGLPAVATLCGGLAVLAVAAVLLLARALGASPVAATAVLLPASSLLIPWLSARPQLVDYVVVPLLVLLLRRILAGRTIALSLAGVGALFVAWVNLHAAVLLGVAIILAVATTTLVVSRGRRGWWCVGAAVIAVTASLINPYGTAVISQAGRVQGASDQLVVEWQHLNVLDPIQVTMVVIGMAALAVAVRRRDVVVGPTLALAMVGGVVAVRVLPIVVLLSLPLLALVLSHPRMVAYARSRRRMLTQGGVVSLLVMLGFAAVSLTHLGRPDPDYYPSISLIDRIPRNARVFNAYDLGGIVILHRPDVTVSLDSRSDMYGDKRILALARVVNGGEDPSGYLVRSGAILIHPTDGLAKRISQDPAWIQVAEEPTATLYVKR